MHGWMMSSWECHSKVCGHIFIESHTQHHHRVIHLTSSSRHSFNIIIITIIIIIIFIEQAARHQQGWRTLRPRSTHSSMPALLERWVEMGTTLKMCFPEMDGWRDGWMDGLKEGSCLWMDGFVYR
jgi:hypothetical protein